MKKARHSGLPGTDFHHENAVPWLSWPNPYDILGDEIRRYAEPV